MPALLDMATCSNLAVPAEVMQHVVNVESGNNPFAIGVVGGRLERQPRNLDEAIATVRMLEGQGYNFSLGVAQVNRYNLAKYGLDTYAKAFDPCPNLVAGTRILAQCYAQAGGDWGKSFSCYYSGNFSKGYDDGYVQKVYDSINGVSQTTVARARAKSTQLAQVPESQPMTAAQHRIRMRASALDTLGAAMATNLLQSRTTPTPASATVATPSMQTPAFSSVAPALSNDQTAAIPVSNEVFVPLVRGANDAALPAKRDVESSHSFIDRADLRLGGHDDAFVF